jgi:hypothetical protein
MSIKETCRPGAPLRDKLFFKRCIFLAIKACYFVMHVNMTEANVGPPQLEKHTLSK